MARYIAGSGRSTSAAISVEMPKIDTRELNKFLDMMPVVAKPYAVASKTIQMWVNETGNGLFTSYGARMAIRLIRSAMLGNIKIKGTNWAAPSASYVALIEKLGYKDARPWHLTGTARKSVFAKKRGKSWEVTIRKNVSTNLVGFRTVAKGNKKRKRLPVIRYVTYMEYGSEYVPPRPLFGPAYLQFVSDIGKPLVDIVKESIADVIKLGYAREKLSTRGEKADTSGLYGDRYGEEAFNEIEMRARLGYDGMSVASSYNKKSIKKMRKLCKEETATYMDDADAMKWMEENMSEIDDLIDDRTLGGSSY